MEAYFTIFLLVAAGAALVMQNLIMVHITEQVSTVLITLLINSGVGLVLLLSALLLRNGINGVTETVSAIRPWVILPGLLGSFFVFSGIVGFQKVGATTTIAVLVASQLITGLLADSWRSGLSQARPCFLTIIGAGLLIVGAVLVARGRV